MVLLTSAIIVAIVFLIIYIVANLNEFCLLGTCWTPVHQSLASKINLWFVVALFFFVQLVIFWLYAKLIFFFAKLPKNYNKYFENVKKKITSIFKR